MKHKFIVVVILLIVVGSIWFYFRQTRQPLHIRKIQPQAVTVAKVVKMTLPNYVTAIGVLKANREINVASQIDGQITAIDYQPGSFVKQGALLFQLDNRIYQAQLRSAQAALHLAELNYHRDSKLAKAGAQAQQVLDQVRATYLEAQAKVQSMQTNLEYTSIKAPFDGYVGAKSVSIGDYVQKGQTLTTLTDRQHLIVEYSLPEQYLDHLKLNQPVTIKLNHKYKLPSLAKVNYIAPTVDVATHSIMVQAALNNASNKLAPGLFVHIKQQIGLARQALVVPQNSIVPTITGAEVYVIKNGHAYARSVKTGVVYNNKVQIIHGLKQGESVVTAGQQFLKNGSLIRIED